MYSHIDIFKNHSFIAIFVSLVKAPEKSTLAFIMLPKKIFFFWDNNFWISSEIIFVSFVDRGCEPLKARSKIYGSLVCLAQFLQKGYNITTLEFPHLDSYRSYLVENFTTLPLLPLLVFLVLVLTFCIEVFDIKQLLPGHHNPCYGMISRVFRESSKDFWIFVKRRRWSSETGALVT